MRSVADALRATLAALGITSDVARAAALDAWPAAAGAAIGGEAARRTRAIRVDGETMVVAVPSPVLAQELRLSAASVVAELERRAPGCGVRAVRFVPSEEAR